MSDPPLPRLRRGKHGRLRREGVWSSVAGAAEIQGGSTLPNTVKYSLFQRFWRAISDF